MAAQTGHFIAIEGIDGAGKSVLASRLCRKLTNRGVPCLLTKEPGSTPAGQKMGEIIKAHPSLNPITRALLFAADRKEHITKVILPALREGHVVISDRYIDSFFAYQTIIDKIPRAVLENITLLTTEYLLPEIVFIVDVEPSIALQRLQLRKQEQESHYPNSAAYEMHIKELRRYFAGLLSESDRYVYIDGNKNVIDMVNDAYNILSIRLRDLNLFR